VRRSGGCRLGCEVFAEVSCVSDLVGVPFESSSGSLEMYIGS
jgi:hypothetical protein